MISGGPSSASYDNERIANESGPGRTATVTVSLQDPGSDYYLAVNSDCRWSIAVTSAWALLPAASAALLSRIAARRRAFLLGRAGRAG